MPYPEPITEVIVLVAAEPTLVPFIDVGGVLWALPGYEFTDEEGSTWTTVAVSDEFFGLDEPAEPGPPDTAVPEPMPIDPVPPTTTLEGLGAIEPGVDVGAVAGSVVGLDEFKAIDTIFALGLTHRIVERDGESFPVTRDLRADRVNLVLADGVVVEAYVG
jgi:hypothetical protein